MLDTIFFSFLHLPIFFSFLLQSLQNSNMRLFNF